MKYMPPNNEQTYVKIVLGKTHNSSLHQQRTYVVQMKNEETLNKFGQVVHRSSREAHILFEECI